MSDPLLAPVEIEQAIDADLPAFDGHFPGAPVLPGAVLVALVLRAIAERPAWARRAGPQPCVQQVKFLAPVGPQSTLTIELQPEAGPAGGVRFEVRCGDVVAASGRWVRGAE